MIRMCALRLLMLFLLAFCYCTEAAAQQYRAFAHRYGIEEGLPHRQVNGILQDRRNFIWAATNGGVVRFDGRKFKVFNQLKDGLGGDRVNWLAEDAEGNIWAGCEGADRWVSIINPVSDVVTPFQDFFKDQAGSVAVGNWMQAPQPLADGTLLIWDSEANGFFTYHPENGWRFRRIENIRDSKLVRITSHQTIWCVYQDVRSTQYVLAELALDGREIRKYPAHPGGDFGLLKGTYFSMQEAARPVFEQWQAELATIGSERMRRVSETRLAEAMKRYDAIVKAAVPAQQQLDAYVKSLRDHAAFLAHDLNPSALDAIQEDVKTVARAAKELDFGLDACAVAARTYVAQNSLPSGTATATPTR